MLIGIIEDDRLLSQALERVLSTAGYDTVCTHTKEEALTLLSGNEDLLLIDIGLPDGDGIRLYQELRTRGKTPAIFLTARDEEKDMLDAFNCGADDYVVKPFSMKILLKRVEVVLKRSGGDEMLVCRDLVLYPGRKQVFLNGAEIALTAKEYQLLEYLMMNQNQVLTKENLLDQVWGLDGDFVSDNTLSVTIGRLRKKIEPCAGQPVYIRNVFGMGYRMGD